MENSRLRDFKEELNVLVQETVDLMKEHETAANILAFEKTIVEKLSHYNPSLMFYGVYNAGKSTILNAIFGEEKASVADVPETHVVTEYPWEGYRLVDTPGINGPDRDYQISSAELVKHDAILFVIDDSEDFDKRNVAQEVLKIIKNDKPLIIVLNNKQIRDTEEEDEQRFHEIRVKFFANLKKEAELAGIPNVEKRYSFIHVNGDTALRGKLYHKAPLIQDSHIGDLEILILQKLKEMEGPKMLLVPADMMMKKVIELQSSLEGQSLSEEDRKLLEYINELITQKNLLYQSINHKVKREIYTVSEQIYSLANKGEDFNPLLTQLQQRLEEIIQQELERMIRVIDEEAQFKLGKVAKNGPDSTGLNTFAGSQNVGSSVLHSETSTSNPLSTASLVASGAVGLSELSKAGSPILKVLTSTILPKAPVPPVVVGGILLNVISWIMDNKRKQKEMEAMKRQVEEANAKTEEMVNQKIAAMQQLNTQVRLQMYKYEEQIMESVRVTLEEIFGEIEEKVKAQISTISEAREAWNQRLHRIRKLRAKVEEFKQELLG